jgi:predicted P-loop ATPase
MGRLTDKIPDGWKVDEKGKKSRSSCCAGDLLRKFEKTGLSYNDLAMEVRLEDNLVKAAEMEMAYMELQIKGWSAKPRDTYDAIVGAAKANSYHPVLQYFKRIESDSSIEPIDLSSVSRDYLGTTDRLADAMLAATLRGAVWRVFNPGCQFDAVLTLKGPQGIRKTSAFRALVPDPDWFSSSAHDSLKDSVIALHRVLITELAELEHHTGRRSAGALKSLITTNCDLIRVPYGRSPEMMPRRSIMVASVNGDEFLRDHTGNRRFWVVDLPAGLIDTDRIARDRDRIWKAAIQQYRKGLEPQLTTAEQALSDRRNQGFMVENPFVAPFEAILPILQETNGFTTEWVIRKTEVCASTEITRKGTRVIQQQISQKHMDTAAEALKMLGFTRDKHQTRENGERARRWRWTDSPDSPSSEGGETAQSGCAGIDSEDLSHPLTQNPKKLEDDG